MIHDYKHVKFLIMCPPLLAGKLGRQPVVKVT